MEDNLSTIENSLTVHVGRAIKARREELQLSLRALAVKSGTSSSMISDIERGTKSPTISTLSDLAVALGVPISVLVDMAPMASPRIRVVRGSDKHSLVDASTGAKRQSFGPAIDGSRVEFLSYLVPPRVTAGPFEPHARGTIEHIHLAAGAVRVVVGDESASLKAGDSCSCRADASHFFDNSDGEVEALIYLVVEPH
jgi:transcriptional regulator with XRE-family HTH domain